MEPKDERFQKCIAYYQIAISVTSAVGAALLAIGIALIFFGQTIMFTYSPDLQENPFAAFLLLAAQTYDTMGYYMIFFGIIILVIGFVVYVIKIRNLHT